MLICSQTYFIDSQTCHAIYLQNYFPKDINTWKMKMKIFKFWNVIFWTKIQNAVLFHYKKNKWMEGTHIHRYSFLRQEKYTWTFIATNEHTWPLWQPDIFDREVTHTDKFRILSTWMSWLFIKWYNVTIFGRHIFCIQLFNWSPC